MAVKRGSNAFSPVTKIGIFVIVLFGGSSIALVLSGHKDKSSSPSVADASLVAPMEKPVPKVVAPVVVVPKAVEPSVNAASSPLAAVVASGTMAAAPESNMSSMPVSVAPVGVTPIAPVASVGVAPVQKVVPLQSGNVAQATAAITAPSGTVPVQITVKVVTPSETVREAVPPVYKRVVKPTVARANKSQEVKPRKKVVTQVKVAKVVKPEVKPMVKLGDQDKVVAGKSSAVVQSQAGSIKVIEKASDDFEFKKHAEVPITTPGKIVASGSKPQYDVVTPAKVVKGPTPVLAKDNAVWVRVNGIRTVQVRVGEKVEGLGVYQGLANGQPKFDGVVVPISN